MTWPAALFWVLILSAFLSRGPALLYVAAVFISFQTVQMVPGELVGGTNILPSSLCMVFLALKVLMKQRPSNILQTLLDSSTFAFLTAFFVWCIFSAYEMPRLFEGVVQVIPMQSQVPWPVPVQPTMQNFTQLAYLTISVLSALAGYFGAKSQYFVRHWLRASVYGGVALIGTGLLDLVLSAAGQSGLLEPFRTATHALLAETDAEGVHRTIGLMDEASAYGGTCVVSLSTLAFLRPCFETKWRDRVVPIVCFGLLAAALLSTSSTAYAGLTVLGLLYAANWWRRSRSPDPAMRAGLSAEASIAGIAAIAFVATLAFRPELLEPFSRLLDGVVFNKASSSSFEDRSMWTRVGLEAFYATWGLGVGFGSARTSNWFVAELCNTGLIGSFLLAWFMGKVFSSRIADKGEQSELALGMKLMLLPLFVEGALAGTSPDVPQTFVFGMILAVTSRSVSMAARVEHSGSGPGIFSEQSARSKG